MAAFWEPEEFIGQAWHKLVGGKASYPHHPEAAVRLSEVRGRLAILFRALGGAGGVRLAGGADEASEHRLTLMQRIGVGTEKLQRGRFDGVVLQLPDSLDVFADRADNDALYDWLVAFFAHAPPGALPPPADPLQGDLLRLRMAHAASAAALAEWPGLGPVHRRLCAAMRRARPRRRLPAQERKVEDLVDAMTGGDAAADADMLAAVRDGAADLSRFRARPGYRPLLPVPLWGEIVPPQSGTGSDREAEEAGGGKEGDRKRRKAKRRNSDQTRRDDPLMLNRFEKILGLAEMINMNRKTEDDDEENARKAAEDLDEISLGAHERKAATKLKLDLDLGVEDSDDDAPLVAELTYPEWDWKRRAYLPDHCRVIAEPAQTQGEDWAPDEAAQKRIRLVRRQFEALRPRRQRLPGQPDGDELDLSALVRSITDRSAGGAGSDRIFTAVRDVARDLSLCVLMDVSLSTDSWIDERRVLDVEKEALLALTHGLSACGDEHAILTFTSHRRKWVSVRTVKDFKERLGPQVLRRIQALRPGHYTRMGAAVRHAAMRLAERAHHQRLLLLLTDGKPNDTDYYEGRYAVEDTRKAIQEARRAGLKVFGVTVDEQGRDYLPYIFGPGAYAVFPHIARLPLALPAIYRQLTTS